MDWRKGYTARYYLSFVDINTWRDTGLLNITGGTIKHELSGLRSSADIDCVNYRRDREELVRVWLNSDQEGFEEDSHTPLFTGYAVSPDRRINGNYETETLQCYSVLLPASDIYLPRGWYAPADMDAIILIKQLLSPTKAIIVVHISENNQNDMVLTRSVIAESGETNLSMVEKLLSIMNWRMWLDGYGRIHIAEYDTDYKETFDSITNDIIEPELTIAHDWFDCPNVVRVIMDTQSAEAYDKDSNTPMSIANRGREVWYEEENVDLNIGETLQEYAERRLKELQRVAETINYDRRFFPDIYPSDIVRLNYPAQDLKGNYMVASQSITLGFSAKTSEEVIKI